MFSFIVRLAIRDGFITTLGFIITTCLGLGLFAGTISISEGILAKIVFTAGLAHLLLPTVFIFFTSLTVSRLITSKELDYFISTYQSRIKFTLSFLLGIAFLCMITCVAFFAIMAIIYHASWNLFGAILWSFTMFGELVIVSFLAAFFALNYFKPISSITITIAMFWFSHIYGFLVVDQIFYSDMEVVFGPILKVTSIVLPRLELFSSTSWLIYPTSPGNITIISAQIVSYISLLIAAILFDFSRRDLVHKT